MKPLLKRIRSIVRTMIPRRVLAEREIYNRLNPEARRIYLRLRVRDALDFRGTEARFAGPPQSVLFVCFGNIMRSPMAGALLQRELVAGGFEHPVRVGSAGLHTLEGRFAHPRALIAAQELGISLANHRAKPLTREMVEQADAIFAMDFQNKAELLTYYPDSKGKIFMLSAYSDRGVRCREISDPFHGDENATRSCYALLQICIRNLANEVFLSSHRSKLDKAEQRQTPVGKSR